MTIYETATVNADAAFGQPATAMRLADNMTVSAATSDTAVRMEEEIDDYFSPYENPEFKFDELNEIVTNARNAYSSAKDNASWAAAYTYLFWLNVNATKAANEWFAKQVEARNDEIVQYNLNAKKAGYPADPAKGLAAGEELVKIGARKGASDFNVIVKYALDFIHSKQATNVSRYVRVLEWVHEKFKDIVVEDAAVLVAKITEVGGFETVVRIQRTQSGAAANTSANSQKADVAPKYETLKNAACLVELKLNAKHTHDNFVVLVGRYADNKVQVLGELKLTKAQLDAAVANIDEMNFQSPEELADAA